MTTRKAFMVAALALASCSGEDQTPSAQQESDMNAAAEMLDSAPGDLATIPVPEAEPPPSQNQDEGDI